MNDVVNRPLRMGFTGWPNRCSLATAKNGGTWHILKPGFASHPSKCGTLAAYPVSVFRHDGKMVVQQGNAPWSSGYQPGALLLSYRTENAEAVGVAPNPLAGAIPFRAGASTLVWFSFPKGASIRALPVTPHDGN